MTLFTKDFFAANRKKLTKSSGADLIVIAANGLMQRNASVTYEFLQDSNFFYLTGVNEPNMLLVINNKTGEDYFIAGPQTAVGEIFDGTVDQDKLAKTSGVERLLGHDMGWHKLEEAIKKQKVVYTIQPPQKFIDVYSMYTNPARRSLVSKLKRAGAEVKNITPDIAALRNIKQEPEIKAIRQAIEVTGQALQYVQENIANYKYEYEVDADITAIFRKQTKMQPGYGSIVASGANACVMHHFDLVGEVDRSKSLLVDVGAQVERYSADITRNFLPKDARINEVHAAVHELQKTALGIIKPGVDFIAYEQMMVAHYGEALKQLGVLDLPLEKNIRRFMPHATSHFLGLDTHDAGDYHQKFQPNMVITVEPGLYLNDEGIGIRIEDDVLITEDGVEVLSASIPTEMKLT